jgi:hypothetical protein
MAEPAGDGEHQQSGCVTSSESCDARGCLPGAFTTSISLRDASPGFVGRSLDTY